MFYVLFWAIVIIAIIGFLKYISKENINFFTRNYYAFPKSLRERIKNTDPFRDLIWFINLLLFILIIFQLGAVLAFKFGNYGAAHTLMKNFFFWFGKEAGYGKLTAMLFSSVAMFIASYHLSKFLKEYRKRSDIEGTRAVIELKKRLEDNAANFEISRDLHFGLFEFIENPGTQEEGTKQMELFRYLETVQLAGTMVRKGIVNVEQFRKQFGCKIDDIVKCSILRDYLRQNRESWADLLWIIREVEKSEKDSSKNTNTSSHNDKTPHHESEMLSKGRDLMKKGGKYLFDDK